MMLALAFTALVSAHSPPPDPATTAPPAPLAQDPAAAAPPSSTPPASTPPKPDVKAAAPAPKSLDPWVVGGVQVITLFAAHALQVPCNLCTCNVWGCTVEPILDGYAATYAGDALGDGRAAAIWPMVAAYATGAISTAIYVALIAGGGALTDALNAANAPAFVQSGSALGAVGIAVAAGTIASLIAVPVTYALVKQPKKPGDDGGGFPGVFSPGGPQGPPVTTSSEVKPSAMQY